jgi:hypothetical protein
MGKRKLNVDKFMSQLPTPPEHVQRRLIVPPMPKRAVGNKNSKHRQDSQVLNCQMQVSRHATHTTT